VVYPPSDCLFENPEVEHVTAATLMSRTALALGAADNHCSKTNRLLNSPRFTVKALTKSTRAVFNNRVAWIGNRIVHS
jgi:aryl-phospho-beta-D-glucosidase BglC (GH1 family)